MPDPCPCCKDERWPCDHGVTVSAREEKRLREALTDARSALHRACLEIGSTEGYSEDFAAINAALSDKSPQ